MLWITKRTGKPDPGMMVNGMLAGLVAITAPCAFVQPYAAAIIGTVAGVIVVEAVLRVGKRALRNNVMRGIAAAAFVAIFFYDAPFPIIIIGTALLGWLGGRLEWRPFLSGGGHGKVGDKQVADADSLLGEETPEHARPNLRWSLTISSIFLALWLVPIAVLFVWLGGQNVFTQIAVFFSKMAVVTFGGADDQAPPPDSEVVEEVVRLQVAQLRKDGRDAANQGDLGTARRLVQQSIDMLTGIGDPDGEVAALRTTAADLDEGNWSRKSAKREFSNMRTTSKGRRLHFEDDPTDDPGTEPGSGTV